MSVRTIIGDCREKLRELADGSVHCCVTSPPYFGLRDYGTAKWKGGEADCDHIARRKPPTIDSSSTLGFPADGGPRRITDGNTYHEAYTEQFRHECGKCGAHRIDSQIGLEPTPDAFVAELVAVFREVRRVLRDDGTLWLNLGDSYATSPAGNKPNTTALSSGLPNSVANQEMRRLGQSKIDKTKIGLKQKDLIGIPWRVAFALQADGWWLRQDIIWAKPNPMPESVTDRCTKAHEYLFLLTKSARYFYDAEAVADKAVADWRYDQERRLQRIAASGGALSGGTGDVVSSGNTRNRRSVWTVATQPFSEAHFATFPPALIEPCILAGCPEKCCSKCGAPWERQTELGESTGVDGKQDNSGATLRNDALRHSGRIGERSVKTLGFAPSCKCNAEPTKGTVLDPFGGAGTTGLVADRLQRNAILIELNPEYAAMADQRIYDDAPLLQEAAE